MLAENMTMFGSQMNDLKDLRGFDDKIGDMSMQMDQSIVMNQEI